MKTEANKLLLRRFYEEVVSTGSVEHIGEFVSPKGGRYGSESSDLATMARRSQRRWRASRGCGRA